MWRVVTFSAYVLRLFYQVFPDSICRNVPHLPAVLSLASLYLFLQALGLIWCFLVSLLAVVSTRLVTVVVGGHNGESAGGERVLLESPLRSLVVCYLYYSLLRIILLFSQSMWIVQWEAYHDFPTMRLLLLGQRRRSSEAPGVATAAAMDAGGSVGQQSVGANGAEISGSPLGAGFPPAASEEVRIDSKLALQDRRGESTSGGEGADEARAEAPKDGSRRRSVAAERRRAFVLTTPIVTLALLSTAALIGQCICEKHTEAPSCKYVFDPTSRLNRNLRFVLFIAMLQWVQAWSNMFPSWDVGLGNTSGYFGGVLLPMTLVFYLLPISTLRLFLWFLRPAGMGVVHSLLGVPHYLVDTVVVTSWTFWLLGASLVIMRPRIIRSSGFSLRRMSDEEQWKSMCTHFKFTVCTWLLAQFVRGSLKFGPAYAQNDLIYTSMLYPVLLCLVWTVTFMAVAMSRFGASASGSLQALQGRRLLLGAIAGGSALLGTAWSLCAVVGRADSPLLVGAVWLHLVRQAFRILRRWGRGHSAAHDVANGTPRRTAAPVRFAVDPNKHTDLRTSYTSERKLGRAVVFFLVIVCMSFLLVLATVSIMAGVQQRQGFFLDDVLWWRSLQNGLEITNAGVSVLTLSREPLTPSADELPTQIIDMEAYEQDRTHYAVCGSKWHGLGPVEYALLSEAAYLNPAEKNDLPGLVKALLPHLHVEVRRTSVTQRKWLEVEVFLDCQGTNASRLDELPRGARHKHRCKSVTVIAISGTDPTRMLDYVENLRMWTEPVALNILSTVFPTVRAWPRDTTALVIGGIHRILKNLAIEDDQWHYKEILEHVRQIPVERHVVITGHSLGGGMALVIGALTGRLAVGLQPPGVYHSLAKHEAQQVAERKLPRVGEAPEGLHRRSVSIVFEGDWIQNFDGHGGLVQTMTCDRTSLSMTLGCHVLEGAICHLMRHCGDPSRNFVACRHDYASRSQVFEVVRNIVAPFIASVRFGTFSVSLENSLSMLVAGLAISVVLFLRSGGIYARRMQVSQTWRAS